MIVSQKHQKVTSPHALANVLQAILDNESEIDKQKEHLWTIGLNTKNVVQYVELVSLGILDASLVHPREVFREAVRSSAAAMILLHNHPSGDTTPSGEDIRITRQLVEAGKLMGIDVLDHVIIGRIIKDEGIEHASLRESGLVEF